MATVLKQSGAPDNFADLLTIYVDPVGNPRDELVRAFALCMKNGWNDIILEAFVAYGKQCMRADDRAAERSIQPKAAKGGGNESFAPGPRPAPRGSGVVVPLGRKSTPQGFDGYELSDFLKESERWLPGTKGAKGVRLGDATAEILDERIVQQEKRREGYNRGIDDGIRKMTALAAFLRASGIKTLRDVK